MIQLANNSTSHTNTLTLSNKLNYFKQAWPIINALQQQGAHQLIAIFNKADQQALMALDALNDDHDIRVLLRPFLARNNQELDCINRQQIIQILRQSDFAENISFYLQSWVSAYGAISKTTPLFQEINYRPIEPLALDFLTDPKDKPLLPAPIENKQPMALWFDNVLHHPMTRERFFNGLDTTHFYQWLTRHDPVYCLARYLIQYYEQAWFTKGLIQFGHYRTTCKVDNLLSNALALLHKEISQEDKQAVLFHAMIKQLFGSDACVPVLEKFLDDDIFSAVQLIKNPEIKLVTQYVNQDNLIALIQQLNIMPSWTNSASYKLILYIFEKHHPSLFAVNHLKTSWRGDDLNTIATFTCRHLDQKPALDTRHAIGHRLLGELIFHMANAGQTSLFYAPHFNKVLAHLSFSRIFLEQLIIKCWIPEGIQEQITHDGRVNLDEYKPFLKKELKDEQGLMDWCYLIEQTWKDQAPRKLPIICVYLLNYSGPKTPLLILLKDYLDAFQNKCDYLYPLSRLLRQFPTRDISFAIFEALESALIKNPRRLDLPILRNMAYFYATTRYLKASFLQAEINLLIYFGQNKHYSLVPQGCEKLLTLCIDKRLKQQLIKGAKEAARETRLLSHCEHSYFNLLKRLSRLFHLKGTHSGMVKHCEDNSPGPERIRAPNEIKLPVCSSQTIKYYPGFNDNKRQLIALLQTVQSSSQITTLTATAQTKQTLFACTNNKEPSAFVDIASQSKVITI